MTHQIEQISEAARKAYAELVDAYGADRAHEIVTVVGGQAKADAFRDDREAPMLPPAIKGYFDGDTIKIIDSGDNTAELLTTVSYSDNTKELNIALSRDGLLQLAAACTAVAQTMPAK